MAAASSSFFFFSSSLELLLEEDELEEEDDDEEEDPFEDELLEDEEPVPVLEVDEFPPVSELPESVEDSDSVVCVPPLSFPLLLLDSLELLLEPESEVSFSLSFGNVEITVLPVPPVYADANILFEQNNIVIIKNNNSILLIPIFILHPILKYLIKQPVQQAS